jgi:hypothetical protein
MPQGLKEHWVYVLAYYDTRLRSRCVPLGIITAQSVLVLLVVLYHYFMRLCCPEVVLLMKNWQCLFHKGKVGCFQMNCTDHHAEKRRLAYLGINIQQNTIPRNCIVLRYLVTWIF